MLKRGLIRFSILMVVILVVLLIRQGLGLDKAAESSVYDGHPQKSRFQKVTASGQQIAANQGPWSCVQDGQEMLFWLVGRDDESVFDSYWTYSWYSPVNDIGEPHRGSCFYKTPGCNVSDIVEQANQQQLCGLSNWRLPSKDELMSLLQEATMPAGALIHSGFFPHTHKGDYWTSEFAVPLTNPTFSHLKVGAVAVSFKHGEARVLPYRNAAFVRLVASKSTLTNSAN